MNKLQNHDWGALVLAGGQSQRMGRDKALLSYGNRSLLDHMSGIAAASGATPVLVGGGTNADIVDPVANGGPAASICALAMHVASQAMSRHWLILPVDMPLLTPILLNRLMSLSANAHFVDQPLPMTLQMSTHTQRTLEDVRNALENGESVSLFRMLGMLKATVVTPTALESARLKNVNTPDEWRDLLADAPP